MPWSMVNETLKIFNILTRMLNHSFIFSCQAVLQHVPCWYRYRLFFCSGRERYIHSILKVIALASSTRTSKFPCLQSNHIQPLQAASAKFLLLFCCFQFAIFLILACRAVATGLPGARNTVLSIWELSPKQSKYNVPTHSTITLPETNISSENRRKPKKKTTSIPTIFHEENAIFTEGTTTHHAPKRSNHALEVAKLMVQIAGLHGRLFLQTFREGEQGKLCFNYIHLCLTMPFSACTLH